MGQQNIPFNQDNGKFIFADFDTEFGQVISDALTLLERFPEIEQMVFRDQELYGEQKKQNRIQYEE